MRSYRYRATALTDGDEVGWKKGRSDVLFLTWLTIKSIAIERGEQAMREWKALFMRKEFVLIAIGVVFVVALLFTSRPASTTNNESQATDIEKRLQVVLS